MVALTDKLHSWWSKAMWAFEPYKKKTNGVVVRFRWLKKNRASVMMDTPYLLTTDPRQQLESHGGEERNINSGQLIRDGDYITITSAERTQPHWEIPKLQWDLSRTAALCGAAEAERPEIWRDPPNDGGGLSR